MGRNAEDSGADRRLPPGWNSVDASTPAGFIYVAVWREFPDMTQLEFDCAWAAPLGSPDNLAGLRVARTKSLAGNAVATVAALRSAREQRLDLSDDEWERLIRRLWTYLRPHQQVDPSEILAELALTHPRPRASELPPEIVAQGAPTRRKPGPTQIVTRAAVLRCRAELRASEKPHGHQALARALDVSVSTIRRRLAGN